MGSWNTEFQDKNKERWVISTYCPHFNLHYRGAESRLVRFTNIVQICIIQNNICIQQEKMHLNKYTQA